MVGLEILKLSKEDIDPKSAELVMPNNYNPETGCNLYKALSQLNEIINSLDGNDKEFYCYDENGNAIYFSLISLKNLKI